MRGWALVVASLLCGAPGIARAESSCAVEGRVLDRASGAPIEEVIVTLLPGDAFVITDAGGRFCFPQAAAGPHALLVRRLGYLTPEPTSIEVTGSPLDPVDVFLLRAGFVEEVVVATPAAGQPADTPARAMPRDEIATTPGTLDDPVRALTALPGVADINDYKGEIRLDGGEPGDTLFLVDGVLVANPYHFRWVRGSTAAFGSSAFDHLEVRTTGLGADIGDTISGVVRLDPTERGAGGTFFDGTFGTLMSSVASGGALANGGTWVASMRYSNLALYRSLYGVDNVQVPDLADMVFRFRAPLAAGVDLVGGALALANGLHTSDATDGSWNDMDAQASLLWAGFDAILSPRLALTARASFSGSRQRYDSSAGDHMDADENRGWFQLRADGQATEQIHYTAGMEGGRLQGAIAGTLADVFDALDQPAPLDAGSSRIAAFGSAQIGLGPAWSIEAGLRADRDSRFGEAPVQGRVRAEYAPGPSFSAHFGAGRYAQFPRFDEQFLAQAEPLVAATSDEMSAGASWPLAGPVAIDVTAFARRMANLTAEVTNRFPDLPEPMGLFESGRSRGLELSVRQEGERLRSRLSLTLLDADQTRDGVTSPRNGDQPWLTSFTSAWSATPRWSLLARAQAGSGLPYSAMIPGGNGLRLPGPLNNGRLPTYERLDLRSMWTTTWRNSRVSAYVEVANILGTVNVRGEDLRYDDTTGAYEIHQEPGMPRLPGFGVSLAWGGDATAHARATATARADVAPAAPNDSIGGRS